MGTSNGGMDGWIDGWVDGCHRWMVDYEYGLEMGLDKEARRRVVSIPGAWLSQLDEIL
ncbi:hypothetical protein BC829DRAFT_409634 [Chytridium lagenaria]|nr:hypothetical protein BC829DRAFT_409634 [Chytridium lagenaria]